MNWTDKLEKRLGWLAIPNLLRYVAILNGLVFVLVKLNPAYQHVLTLDPAAIMSGEVWRLVTHIFIPRIGGLLPGWIEVLFYLLFLNWLGDGLEEAMGPFKVNLYYYIGMLGTTIAAFMTGRGDGGFLLNNSLLFAFVWFYPNMEVLFFLLIPVKIKWLAVLDLVIVGIYFLSPGWPHKLGVLASLSNFAIFFGPDWIRERWNARQVRERRERFEVVREAEETLHSCAVCGCTEMSDPSREFRVAKDGREYCVRHLPSGGDGGVGA